MSRGPHKRLRPIWAARIRLNGGWTCRRCGNPIHPGDPYDLGHPTDATPGGPGPTLTGIEPEHPHCNRSAGATAGNTLRANQLPASRDW